MTVEDPTSLKLKKALKQEIRNTGKLFSKLSKIGITKLETEKEAILDQIKNLKTSLDNSVAARNSKEENSENKKAESHLELAKRGITFPHFLFNSTSRGFALFRGEKLLQLKKQRDEFIREACKQLTSFFPENNIAPSEKSPKYLNYLQKLSNSKKISNVDIEKFQKKVKEIIKFLIQENPENKGIFSLKYLYSNDVKTLLNVNTTVLEAYNEYSDALLKKQKADNSSVLNLLIGKVNGMPGEPPGGSMNTLPSIYPNIPGQIEKYAVTMFCKACDK